MSTAVRPIHATVPAMQSKGRVMTAPEVSEIVCEGRVSTKWVIQRMAPHIGSKPGRCWFFFENEARAWWMRYLTRKA